MGSEIVAALKQRFQFAGWDAAIGSAERLFAYQYAMRGREAPGWTLVKQTQMRVAPPSAAEALTRGDAGMAIEIQRAPGAAAAETAAAAEAARVVSLPAERHATIAGVPFDRPPAHTRTFWQNPEISPDVRVEAELHECASMRYAHEWLIHLLGAMESPLIRRLEDPPFGEVCFSGPSPTAFVFVRGNLVVNIRNASRHVVDVSGFARNIDADLLARPRVPGARKRSAREAAAAIRRTAARERIPLVTKTAAEAGLARSATKIFYTDGDVEADEDSVYFLAARPGTYRIRIYSMGPSDRVQFQELPIEVSG